MTAEQLLELQLNDTAIDQIRHRMPRLPEVVAAQEANAALAAWQRRVNDLRVKVSGFEAEIAAAEKSNETINTKRERLEKQLKTVIAPREAEALMHEIETLRLQRSDLDDAELIAMERLSDTETELAALGDAEAPLLAAVSSADAAAAAARAEAEAELAERTARSEAMRDNFDAALLARYDSMRAAHDGVAVARLNGLRCEGCHLDLSRAEADTIKTLSPDEFGECPNCGRLLVR